MSDAAAASPRSSELPRIWLTTIVAVACLTLASPPARLPFGEFLVVPGLAAWFSVVTAARRPLLASYVLGLVRLGCIAWSLIGVAGAAYVAIVLLGAVYDLSIAVVTLGARRWSVRLAAFGFGVGAAATGWLRANFPEIPYPHGQLAHALYEWPSLLGPVAWGGETLANLMLAWLAASMVVAWRAWRVGSPSPRCAKWQLPAALSAWILACCIAPPSPAVEQPGAEGSSAEGVATRVDVVAIEPGPSEVFRGRRIDLPREAPRLLVEPTLEVAGPTVEAPPDLVLWPESSLPDAWLARLPFVLAPGTALLAGSTLPSHVLSGGPADARPEFRTVALLYDADGRFSGQWHEKQVPVPAAERMPALEYLPEWVLDLGERIVGYSPILARGRMREPLRLAGGAQFAGLVCYDNAFDVVTRRHVAAGARLLAVISNEIWYDGGAELDQMVAMSVFRALETRTPIVRSTVDGRSVAIGGDGRPLSPTATSAAGDGWPRFLRFDVELGPGALGPLAWMHTIVPWFAVFLALAAAVAIRRK